MSRTAKALSNVGLPLAASHEAVTDGIDVVVHVKRHEAGDSSKQCIARSGTREERLGALDAFRNGLIREAA